MLRRMSRVKMDVRKFLGSDNIQNYILCYFKEFKITFLFVDLRFEPAILQKKTTEKGGCNNNNFKNIFIGFEPKIF